MAVIELKYIAPHTIHMNSPHKWPWIHFICFGFLNFLCQRPDQAFGRSTKMSVIHRITHGIIKSHSLASRCCVLNNVTLNNFCLASNWYYTLWQAEGVHNVWIIITESQTLNIGYNRFQNAMNFDKRFHNGMTLRCFLLPVEFTYTGPVTRGISVFVSPGKRLYIQSNCWKW